MMRFPCTACGGRGPHLGEGHQYTTDPDYRRAETDRRTRIVDIITAPSSGVSDAGKLALALAVGSMPDPPEEFWRERDGVPGIPPSASHEMVSLPYSDTLALQERVTKLMEWLKRLDSDGVGVPSPSAMHEVRSVLTVVTLMLDSALAGL